MPEQTTRIELVSRIVTAYVSGNAVAASAIDGLLRDVDRALAGLSRPPEAKVSKPSPAEIRASIRPDGLVSFEDGRTYKALRRHLTTRGLTPEAYRAKWGLPVDYPLVSADYSARRSKISHAISRRREPRSQLAAE
ncbi:MucR family transcriptional regulator [Methylobacterium radiodurans]|uniref:MucR family transcriptional regulator n=1 Tax=Methylobacterium radiodurans TaxID=2202828 RepID=A0A2U8VL92_9HYPH|nr:MucR family transcriptional regulator [Methylobacterium radiodurans]AWN34419.1 MucR family transcriptional regulator [Methylobacterium radiodurans]